MTELLIGLVVGSVVERLCRHLHNRADGQLAKLGAGTDGPSNGPGILPQ